MAGKTVLISGIGVAGPALAHWLLRAGFEPTLVERAPQAPTHGYVIDFWGLGYDIVERMGLLPEVLRAGYHVREVRLVDRDGRRTGGFDADVFRSATRGRYTSLARGDLSDILFRAIEGRAEALFGNSIVALEEDRDGVLVRFQHGAPRRFDLVVGADGLHSAVRELAMGPESRFERFLGYTVAAFEASGYRPRDEGVYIAHSVPGRQLARFSMSEDRTMFLFVVAEKDGQAAEPSDSGARKVYLRDRFADMGWESHSALEALDRCDALYFDRVSQIRMESWSKGRIGLVGDAAFAPSLLAGQGSALAIIGAYVLAGELARAARVEDAFRRYEELLRPFIQHKQKAAERFAGSFAPRTRLGIFARNQITKALSIPWLARLALGSSLVDRIELPDYAAA